MKTLALLILALVARTAVAQSQTAADTAVVPAVFVPGTILLFQDDFRKAKPDSVPANWELLPINPDIPSLGGVREIHGRKALVLTQGNFGGFRPVLPKGIQLGDAFSVEYDYFQDEASCCAECGAGVYFNDTCAIGGFQAGLACDHNLYLAIWLWQQGKITYYCQKYKAKQHRYQVPGTMSYYPGTFDKKAWHHIALSCRDGQISYFVDDHFILAARACFNPTQLLFEGCATFAVRNVRIAAYPPSNAFRQLELGDRLVTQAIRFDVDRSVIRPESLPYLTQLAGWLQQHPAVRLQINGHTDGDGAPAHNLQLSLERANAIKARLVSTGIAADRLEPKGFGATQPVDTTTAGKFRNRRVELVKLP